jgi:Trk K+ transport system NAD-binding subunit
VVLCGLDRLGLRILEELKRLGLRVAVIARSPDEHFAARARELGATLIQGWYRDESVLRAAGVETASAVVLAQDDDVGNLHAGLAARELNTNARLVLRIFNQQLRLRASDILPGCAALSASAIAAPAFVSAALDEGWDQSVEALGHVLALRVGKASDHDVLLPLACLDGDAARAPFPTDGERLLSLYDAGPAESAEHERRRDGSPHPPAWASSLWALLSGDRRLRVLGAFLLGLATLSIAVFYFYAGLDPVTALYFTVTVMTTTGFGDISLRGASAALRLYGTALMLLGAAGLTLLYALITDALVGARLARGPAPGRQLTNHIVVCGLGNVGYRVVEALARRGVPVAVAELREDAPFLPAVRTLGVPVVVADSTQRETLEALRVSRARCLVAVTDDDVANLESILTARTLNPNLRVVLRLFDPDFAARAERAFGVHISRSTWALAAPAFAAAAVGEHVLAAVAVGDSVVVLVEVEVENGSRAVGLTIANLEAATGARVVLYGGSGWRARRAARADRIAVGDRLVAATPRSQLTSFLAATEAPGPAGGWGRGLRTGARR